MKQNGLSYWPSRSMCNFVNNLSPIKAKRNTNSTYTGPYAGLGKGGLENGGIQSAEKKLDLINYS